MEQEFLDWYAANEKRFVHGQFGEKDIAYSAWRAGKGFLVNVEPEVKKYKPEDRYYFKVQNAIGFSNFCIEDCYYRNDGTMIGSVNCQLCPYLIEKGENEHERVVWIKCKKINKAVLGI